MRNAHLNIDLSRIEQAETRRALRSLVQQLQEITRQQQVEIEALLDMMVDKNIGSLGEFKRYVTRIVQHSDERIERVHSQIAQAFRDQPPVQPLQARQSDVGELPSEDHHVYRL